MNSTRPCVLMINGGSSSIRFAVFTVTGGSPRPLLAGKIDRIGVRGARFAVGTNEGSKRIARPVVAASHRVAAEFILDWLQAQAAFGAIVAIGHRVVHGLKHSAPARVTPKLFAQLRRFSAYDPEHLPGELTLIDACRRRHPRLPQVACFDTAFHHGMPRVAKLLPLPRRVRAKGVERYGFHGLSYAYLMEELRRIDPVAARGRVILAHLGNGASLAAVQSGRSVDTSMGFSPASGLVMGSRSGDLDPGLVYFLARTERMTPVRFQRLVNHESGLLGISGTNADVRDLLAREARDPRAAEALALFCYQAKKWIGAYAAVLGGLDTIVFTGGIGENSAAIRARICIDLEFLGVELDRKRNARHAPVISTTRGRVVVRVIRTNEELMMARSVCRVLGFNSRS